MSEPDPTYVFMSKWLADHEWPRLLPEVIAEYQRLFGIDKGNATKPLFPEDEE